MKSHEQTQMTTKMIKPKTKAGKRALEKRAPKIVREVRALVFLLEEGWFDNWLHGTILSGKYIIFLLPTCDVYAINNIVIV